MFAIEDCEFSLLNLVVEFAISLSVIVFNTTPCFQVFFFSILFAKFTKLQSLFHFLCVFFFSLR